MRSASTRLRLAEYEKSGSEVGVTNCNEPSQPSPVRSPTSSRRLSAQTSTFNRSPSLETDNTSVTFISREQSVGDGLDDICLGKGKLSGQVHAYGGTFNPDSGVGNKPRFKITELWKDDKKKSKLKKSVEDLHSALSSAERAKADMEYKCDIMTRQNDDLRRELQKTKDELSAMERSKVELMKQLNDKKGDTKQVNEESIKELASSINAQLQAVTDAAMDVIQKVQADDGSTHSPPRLGMDALDNIESLLGHERFGILRRKKDSATLSSCIHAEVAIFIHQFVTTWPLPQSSPMIGILKSLYETIGTCGEISSFLSLVITLTS